MKNTNNPANYSNKKNTNQINYSINVNWTGKPKRKMFPNGKVWNVDDNGKYINLAEGWTNTTGTIENLLEAVNFGFAISWHFKDKDFQYTEAIGKAYRTQKRFVRSGLLMVDIDHGLRLDQARENEIFKKYACGLYTSASHSEEEHRFRIIFQLEEDITDGIVLKHCLTWLINEFGGDGQCKDAARLFYGAVDCHTECYPDKIIDKKMIRKMTKEGKELLKKSVGHSNKKKGRKSESIRIYGSVIIQTPPPKLDKSLLL